MKIVRFVFIILFTSPIIYFTLFFDSVNFKNSIAKNISSKIDGDIKFDNQIDLTFFPNPKIILYNLSFSDQKKTVNVPNTEITPKWMSLVSGNLEFKKIRFLNPNIFINVSKVNQSQTFYNYFVNVNINNNYKIMDLYIKLFDKIEVENGNLKIFTYSGEQTLENINLLFNNIRKQIDLNFFFKNLNSNFFLRAKSQSENYEVSDVSIEQKIHNHKEKIFLNGVFTIKEKKLEFNGQLNTKSLDISKLLQLNVRKKTEKDFFLKRVKNSFSDFFKIKINVYIDKLLVNDQTLNNVTFNSLINNNFMKIEQLSCNYLGGILRINADYTKVNNRLKGVLFFQDFSLPSDLFRKIKYDISGGKNNLSSSFESFFVKYDIQSLIRNLNLIGKLEIENAVLHGIDLKEISKKIDNFSGINDIFEILKLSKNSKESNIDSIKSDFTINNNELKFDNLTSRSSNVTVHSSGKYFLNTKKLDVLNEIKIKSEKFPNFPSFKVNFQGLVNELDYIYDFKNLKEYLISRSLEKLLKKNKQKLDDFDNLLDFFID